MLTSRGPKNAKLSLCIERLWCVSDPSADGFETLLPSGRVQIIFSLSDIPLATDNAEATSFQVVQGPTSRPRRVSRKSNAALCGVSFCPGGAGPLLGRMDQFADRVIPLECSWSTQEPQIVHQLRALNSHDARLDLLEHKIFEHVHDVSDLALIDNGLKLLRNGEKVANVCDELGCSPYIFRKKFLRNVGFTPKHFLRIERFRTAARQLTPDANLADTALAAAFSDQSHMTRETEHFALMTPGHLRSKVRPHPGHINDDTA